MPHCSVLNYMVSKSDALSEAQNVSEFKKGSISILLMLDEFGVFAHFTLVGIEFLIHFHGFSVFLLLKTAKNNCVNKNIKMYFFIIYA